MTPSIPGVTSAKEVAKKVAGALKSRRKKDKENARKLPQGQAYGLTCGRVHGHVGIIFGDGVNPLHESMIHGGMWFSTYHDISEAFFGERGHVVCQDCLEEFDERVPLRIDMAKGPPDLGFCFKVPVHWKRFVVKVNMDDILKAVEANVPDPEREPEKKSPPKPEEQHRATYLVDPKKPKEK